MDGMKVAGILALVIGIGLGAWALNGYQKDEEVRREFAQQGTAYIDFRNDTGGTSRLDVRKMSDYYERHDAEIGAVSVAFFIGSILLFRRRRRPATLGSE